MGFQLYIFFSQSFQFSFQFFRLFFPAGIHSGNLITALGQQRGELLDLLFVAFLQGGVGFCIFGMGDISTPTTTTQQW